MVPGTIILSSSLVTWCMHYSAIIVIQRMYLESLRGNEGKAVLKAVSSILPRLIKGQIKLHMTNLQDMRSDIMLNS